jgi:hypothetical protein
MHRRTHQRQRILARSQQRLISRRQQPGPGYDISDTENDIFDDNQQAGPSYEISDSDDRLPNQFGSPYASPEPRASSEPILAGQNIRIHPLINGV